MHHMIFELMKNSMRATMENMKRLGESEPEPINVIISHGDNDISIKVGIPEFGTILFLDIGHGRRNSAVGNVEGVELHVHDSVCTVVGEPLFPLLREDRTRLILE